MVDEWGGWRKDERCGGNWCWIGIEGGLDLKQRLMGDDLKGAIVVKLCGESVECLWSQI